MAYAGQHLTAVSPDFGNRVWYSPPKTVQATEYPCGQIPGEKGRNISFPSGLRGKHEAKVLDLSRYHDTTSMTGGQDGGGVKIVVNGPPNGWSAARGVGAPASVSESSPSAPVSPSSAPTSGSSVSTTGSSVVVWSEMDGQRLRQ
jgi:hypothetical protein